MRFTGCRDLRIFLLLLESRGLTPSPGNSIDDEVQRLKRDLSFRGRFIRDYECNLYTQDTSVKLVFSFRNTHKYEISMYEKEKKEN